jgi:hypothetical protein
MSLNNEIYTPNIKDSKRLEKLTQIKDELEKCNLQEMTWLITKWANTNEKYINLFNINTALLYNFIGFQNKNVRDLENQNLSKTYIFLENLPKKISFVNVLSHIDVLEYLYLEKEECDLSPMLVKNKLNDIITIFNKLGKIKDPFSFENHEKYNKLYDWFIQLQLKITQMDLRKNDMMKIYKKGDEE